jgi:hypothetical protein
MINALFGAGGAATIALFFAAFLFEPVAPPQRQEICTELSFEQRGGQVVPRDRTAACQTRATGDAQ